MDQRQQYRQQPARPQTTATPATSAPKPTAFQPQVKEKPVNKYKKYWWIPVVILVLFAVAWYFLRGNEGSGQINTSKYQAVFMNNGQVYFGKLHDFYGEKPYLTDVYYIQAADGSAANTDSKEAKSTQKLIKLGKEIHGPENSLILNKDAVLFVENLTDGSNVVKAIKSDTNK